MGGFEFDNEYFIRLSKHDLETAEHFGIYFGLVLNRKLRCRCRNPEMVEDVRQETLRRVLVAVKKGEFSNPRKFEAFVCSVCSNVLFEHWRAVKKHSAEELQTEPAGHQPDPEQAFSRSEAAGQLWQGLRALSQRDRELLQMAYFEEQDYLELSMRLSVSRTYARVLVHRAIVKLRDALAAQANRVCFQH